jgi:hypothetical protein
MPVICTHCCACYLMDLRHVVRARNRPDQGGNAGAACQGRWPHGCAARRPCSVVLPKVSSVVTVPSHSDAHDKTEFIRFRFTQEPTATFQAAAFLQWGSTHGASIALCPHLQPFLQNAAPILFFTFMSLPAII